MIRLVVNADDLGLHPAIDEGIFRAHRDGIVTSATLIATGRGAAEAVRRARAEGLALGVHLCLSTHLAPAAAPDQVPTVAPGGAFRASWSDFVTAWARGKVRLSEVELELRAQVARARELGANPDHLDGHQHLHVLPGVAAVVLRLAREEGLAVRWPADRPHRGWASHPGAGVKALVLSALALAQRTRTARTVPGLGVFEAGRLDEAALLEILEKLPDGTHELGAHPGLRPERVAEDPSWQYAWDTELAALCSARAREVIERRGITLTTYSAI